MSTSTYISCSSRFYRVRCQTKYSAAMIGFGVGNKITLEKQSQRKQKVKSNFRIYFSTICFFFFFFAFE